MSLQSFEVFQDFFYNIKMYVCNKFNIQADKQIMYVCNKFNIQANKLQTCNLLAKMLFLHNILILFKYYYKYYFVKRLN